MLFMKGSPDAPQCGFSARIVKLIEKWRGRSEYGTFDILTDSEVREGLKQFSKWPTYPQLYVKGKLIGGIDICQEMDEEGELEDILSS
jgi:Grx4 family monothiol glutaredoxin